MTVRSLAALERLAAVRSLAAERTRRLTPGRALVLSGATLVLSGATLANRLLAVPCVPPPSARLPPIARLPRGGRRRLLLLVAGAPRVR